LNEKKSELEKIKKKQKNLAENAKRDLIDVDTFYDVFIHYSSQIENLEDQIETINLKNSYFGNLDTNMQKEIISKYVTELQVSFSPKKYKSKLFYSC